MPTLKQQTLVDRQLLDEIYRAREVMAQPESPVKETELIYDEQLSERYGAEVWLASEIHQPIRAYKIRGAYNFVHNMTDEEKQRGLVTASAGNHGQGIALSGNRAGVDTHVFMPKNTPEIKVDRVASLGGESVSITLVGDTFDEAQAFAKQYCDETRAVFAPPFNDMKVIAGQGTLGLEITEKLPGVDMVFCPVGGMGLLAGISTAIKHSNPEVEIIGVEPDGAPSLQFAHQQGGSTLLKDKIDTFVDGAAVRQVGDTPFRLASHLVSDAIVVSNTDVRQATTELWEREEPVHAELAGALSVAGLPKYGHLIKGKTVVCIVSGGNLSPERYEREVRLPGKKLQQHK